jgi:hypothetical protein
VLIQLRRYANLFPFVIALVLLGYLFASVNRPLWYDEILTVYPVTDPSFSHMIAACREPMNTAPPLYFIALWGYVHLVGATPLALRSLSALSFAGVVFLLWRLLRPRYGARVAASAIIATTFVPSILEQVREARFYGLYSFFAALTLYIYLSRDTERLPPALRAVLLYFSSAAMTFTHTFGLFYSGSLLLGQAVQNLRVFRRSREPVALTTGWENAIAIVLSWALFFAVWGPTSSAQQAAFGGKTWIIPPTIALYLKIVFTSSAFFFFIPIALFGVSLFLNRQNRLKDILAESDENAGTLYLLFGLAFIFVPVTIGYIYSILSMPCLLWRYFLPLWQGWSLVISYCLYHGVNGLNVDVGKRRRILYLYFAAVCLMGAWSLWTYLIKFPVGNRNLSTVTNTSAINDALRRSGVSPTTPIVFSQAMLFAESYFYQPEPKYRYLYIADDGFAKTGEESGTLSSFHVNVRAWGRKYLGEHIVTPSSTVIKSMRFVVVEDFHAHDNWVIYMLRKNPGLRAEIIGETKIVNTQFPELPESTLILYHFTEAKSDALKAQGDPPIGTQPDL